MKSVEVPFCDLKPLVHGSQAILIAGLAAVELLRAEHGIEQLARASACAGFDAGELTALVYAGALDFEDALRLIQVWLVGTHVGTHGATYDRYHLSIVH